MRQSESRGKMARVMIYSGVDKCWAEIKLLKDESQTGIAEIYIDKEIYKKDGSIDHRISMLCEIAEDKLRAILEAIRQERH